MKKMLLLKVLAAGILMSAFLDIHVFAEENGKAEEASISFEADKIILNLLTDEAQNILQNMEAYRTESLYAPESVQALRKALSAARELMDLDDPQITEENLERAGADLEEALKRLPDSVSDKTALILLSNALRQLRQQDYTEDSYFVLTTEIANADPIIDDPFATFVEVDAALAALQAAAAKLTALSTQGIVDTTELEELIQWEEAMDRYEYYYTDESYLSWKDAMENARNILNSGEAASSEQVSGAVGSLVDAIGGLRARFLSDVEGVADTTGLEALLDNARALPRGEYTTKTYQVLAQAIEQAENLLKREEGDIEEAENTDDITIEAVEQVTADLEAALKGLTRMEGSMRMLQSLTASAMEVEPELLAPECRVALQAAVEEAEKVLENADAASDEVENAVQRLMNAMVNLKYASDASAMVVRGLLLNLLAQAGELLEAAETGMDGRKELADMIEQINSMLEDFTVSEEELQGAMEQLSRAMAVLLLDQKAEKDSSSDAESESVSETDPETESESEAEVEEAEDEEDDSKTESASEEKDKSDPKDKISAEKASIENNSSISGEVQTGDDSHAAQAVMAIVGTGILAAILLITNKRKRT